MILRPAVLLVVLVSAGCIVDYQMRTNRFISAEGAWSRAEWDGVRDDVASFGISLVALWGKARAKE